MIPALARETENNEAFLHSLLCSLQSIQKALLLNFLIKLFSGKIKPYLRISNSISKNFITRMDF
jgi:hypothetical protein